MCGLQATRCLENHHGGLVRIEPLSRFEQPGGRGAVDPDLRGEMMPAIADQFTNSDQIGMVDLGSREGLACELGQEDGIGRPVGRQQFEHARRLERQGLRQDNPPSRTVPQKFAAQGAHRAIAVCREAGGVDGGSTGKLRAENGPLDRIRLVFFGCHFDPCHRLGEHAGVELGDDGPRAIRLGDRELEQPVTPRATGREASGP